MPTINPALVPTINPGDLFDEFTTDSSLNIRWLTATDPAYYEVINRPISDSVLRQLILAKAIDDLNISLGYQALFPFVIPPQVSDGSTVVDVPIRTFWDLHISIPIKWIDLRLARIDRLDGENATEYTGTLRFVFTASQNIGGTSSAEIALFYADYEIDSNLTFQRVRIEPATSTTVPVLNTISAGERVTIDGEIIFRTLDANTVVNQAFFDLLAPGSGAYYEIVNSSGIGGTDAIVDFDISAINHGTGILTSSSYNLITPVDADPVTWLESFNFPFDLDASLQANGTSGVIIPQAIFREMDIVAPAGDETTGDVSNALFPVWVSKIERDGGASVPTIVFHFSTKSIDPTAPSSVVEFATLTLTDDMIDGQIVAIVPNNHLFINNSSDTEWHQEFGRGHVVLSNKWGVTSGEIDSFFTSIPLIVGGTSMVTFDQLDTRISAMAISRVPKYSPTMGQAAALRGTSSNRVVPLHPNSNNQFVTSLDDGFGDLIDLDSQTGVTSNSAIDRYGNAGSRVRQLVKLIVDPEAASTINDPNFYADEILPRLRILLGRDPKFGDQWYQGNRFMTYNGDSWIG